MLQFAKINCLTQQKGVHNLPMEEVSKLLLSMLQVLVSLSVRIRLLPLLCDSRDSRLTSLAVVTVVATETSSFEICRPIVGLVRGWTQCDSWGNE